MTAPANEAPAFTVDLEFRTAQSFLMAYSVNLSRGGLFVETDAELAVGARTNVVLRVPGADPIVLVGVVTFRRPEANPDGPPGVGVELADVMPLGIVVDQLVPTFHGVQVLVLSGDRQDRTTLARSIKSIISTADIMQAADISVARSLMTTEVDLAVIDIDFDLEGGLAMLRAAHALNPRVPTVAITAKPELHDVARDAGADDLASNPPPFSELQVVLVRAMSKPVAVVAGPAS